jgi:hypothetical protein
MEQLADKTPDGERLRDGYLYQSGEWRRITAFGFPSNTEVTVTRASGIIAGAAQVYFMLDPDELNAAINEALKECYFIEVETIIPIANTYTYVLPTWVQKRGQVIGVKWRDISQLGTQPREVEVGSYSVKEDANACTLYINDPLQSVTTYDIQFSGRRNYSALANDSAITTCPYKLIFGMATVSILHKIFQKYGKGMAGLFGSKIMVAEKELMTLKNDWLPRLQTREYVEEEAWIGPDKNPYFDSPPW